MLKLLIQKNKVIFGKVQNLFFTIEFQQRGNEHEHRLLLVYEKNSKDEITCFVD